MSRAGCGEHEGAGEYQGVVMRNGWQTKRLGDFAVAVSTGPFGSILHKSDYVEDGVPLVNPINIVGERIVPDQAKLISEVTKQRLTNYVLKEGDVVVARRGEIGRCAVIGPDEKGWVCGTGSFFIRPLPAINSQFLAHLIRSDAYRERLEQLSTGTTMKNLSNTSLGDLSISVPSLSEQQRIVSVLDEVFDGIATAKANAETNLLNARALFASHLQSVFTQRGEGWVEKRLGEICERVSVGHVGPTSEFYCGQSEGIPFLRSQNVRRGRLDWDGIQYVTKEFHQELRKSRLRAGDLLFVRVGANRGDCCSVPSDVGEINCANIVFARLIERNADYLERYCESTHGRAQLLGMTTGSAQGVINTSSVAELLVPIPPLLEQKRIVNSSNELQAETQRLESIYQRKLAALDDLKKSLLHQAFSGQLSESNHAHSANTI